MFTVVAVLNRCEKRGRELLNNADLLFFCLDTQTFDGESGAGGRSRRRLEESHPVAGDTQGGVVMWSLADLQHQIHLCA